VSEELCYLIFADTILFIHAVFVVFVVLGLLLICAGGLRNWSWVRNLWFRLVHLLSVGVVVLQSWLGMLCPLTVWEVALREKAGDVVYTGSFVAHWLESLLYYRAPDWIFVVVYTVFGMLVIASWFFVRPHRPGVSS
jgi:hypothetical protein